MGCRVPTQSGGCEDRDFHTTRIQNDGYHYLIFESVEYVTQEIKDVHKIKLLPAKG